MELEPGMAHMGLRRRRSVVTLAEELHFGRAAALGVLVPEGDRLAASPEVLVAKLTAQLAASRGSCRGGVGAA